MGVRVGVAGGPVRVFLSYAHEDDAHAEAVRRLWLLLRSLGVDAKLDLTATAQRQFWPEWMDAQVREADFVLVIASAAYRERAENRGEVTTGKGVRWEARRIQERFYADQEAGLRQIVPVILPGGDVDGLPGWLLPNGATVFRLKEISEAGVEKVMRVLTAQPREVEPPLGKVPTLPSRAGAVPRAGVATELLIEAEVRGSRLVSEVSLAGSPVCRREADLPAGLDRVWQVLSGSPVVARQRLAEAGLALAALVFDEVGQRLVADLVAGLPPGDEVEVVWRADAAGLRLPVELLTLTTTAGERLDPLALLGGVSVRRQVPTTRSPGPAGLAGPLRVLAAVAAPEETRTANAPLDVEAEMQALLDAVAELGGQVRILEVASLSQIKAALTESEFHVLHLSAHGSPTTVELEDEDGNPQPAGCRELMTALKDARAGVPLIVLSSCAGAAGGDEALAAAMIAAGADRVLAMQAPVTDRYATRLLAAFYRELAAPAAGAAGALARARRDVERVRPEEDRQPRPEYAVATLLCAGPDEPLIDARLPPVELTAQVVPSGTTVRELGLGQLIGRRSQLREATAVLRRTGPARERHGVISGVQLTGIGGIGKTALAGRLVTRLRAEGLLPVVHDGRWNPTALFAGLADALQAAHPDDPIAALLASAEVPDTAKADLVGRLLGSTPVILVFDDFEQNLSPGGGAFLDPAFDEVFTAWCEAADTGLILVTCRYPLTGEERYLVEVPVGPLSAAELRRLLLRLPALRSLTGDDLRLLTRAIGGHPRLIEYVDALLRGRPARFREVHTRLKALAAREGIDLTRPRLVGEAVEDALLLGGADILLDELLGLLTDHEREVLLQVSVSRAPMTLDDLAYALAEPASVRQLAAEHERLTDLTLLAPVAEVLAHPWTATLLERRPDVDRLGRHERALKMRMRRMEQRRLRYEDLLDIPRHLAALDRYDEIPGFTTQVVAVLGGVLAAAAYLAEIRPLIPATERAWAAVARQEFEAIRSSGDLASAATLLTDMRLRIEQRLAADPGDEAHTADMVLLLINLGDLAIATGDLATARHHYQQALEHRPRSSDLSPWWQSVLAAGHERLGGVAVAAGNLTDARKHYQADLDIRQRLVAADPGDSEWQRALSVSRNKLGDVAVAAGDLADAREHYEAGLDIRRRLVAADPGNSGWQRDLSVSRNKLGDVARAAGDLTGAEQHYEAGLDTCRQLVAADPANSEWQRDLSVGYERLGDVARAAGNLTDARQHYQASLDIAQRLAAADPGNSEWQRDLSVGHERLGDVARAAGDLADAREHYEAGLDIRRRLVAADPGNSGWQRDLSVSRNKLGDVAHTAGDLTGAREHYEASLNIVQRLAAVDPGNRGWQRDLSVGHERLGDVALSAGDLADARERYEAGLDIRRRLAAVDPGNKGWQRDLSVSHERLGDVARAAGDLTAARERYQACLDIAQRLAAADPGNSEWHRDLATIQGKIDEIREG
ncbi:hypothetical protein Ade02nite_01180 [Paractinoplanes deccanensis]|uniref:SEFIR domain-containing protein n=1 Tax=Paractinoplanes deccanensis TaxID=113561 RepID=A0ABQ3XUR4_9ACTN|nr:CHAT domain-containing protein [Actinoplanes deccanensis]GID71477.1 hypothetical protein Ade02nite_01180 [Actinoplanes deccanensis]